VGVKRQTRSRVSREIVHLVEAPRAGGAGGSRAGGRQAEQEEEDEWLARRVAEEDSRPKRKCAGARRYFEETSDQFDSDRDRRGRKTARRNHPSPFRSAGAARRESFLSIPRSMRSRTRRPDSIAAPAEDEGGGEEEQVRTCIYARAIISMIIITNMLMPVRLNDFTRLRALLVFNDRDVLAHATSVIYTHLQTHTYAHAPCNHRFPCPMSRSGYVGLGPGLGMWVWGLVRVCGSGSGFGYVDLG
jgi:hypothetical protein